MTKEDCWDETMLFAYGFMFLFKSDFDKVSQRGQPSPHGASRPDDRGPDRTCREAQPGPVVLRGPSPLLRSGLQDGHLWRPSQPLDSSLSGN